jgi:hypothetical protein
MRWINMLNLLKHVMSKYKSLIMKMHLDSSKTKAAQNNLVLLGDLELILGLPCSLLMFGSHVDFYQICTTLGCVHC